MARARLLKPGFFENEDLAKMPPHGRLLFQGLWTLADREGRLHDRPAWIKGQIFAYENVKVDGLLAQLDAGGFIQRYEVEGARYIQVVKFEKHQSPHVREPASTIPAPGSAPDKPGASPVISGTGPAVAVAVSDPVAVAEAETVDARPPEHPFAFLYAQKYAERNPGRRVPPAEHASALALEREFGAQACIDAASDLDWQKHPNYLKPKLEDQRNGVSQSRSQPSRSTRSATTLAGSADENERWRNA